MPAREDQIKTSKGPLLNEAFLSATVFAIKEHGVMRGCSSINPEARAVLAGGDANDDTAGIDEVR